MAAGVSVAIFLISFASRNDFSGREKVESGFAVFSQLNSAEWLDEQQFLTGDVVPPERLKLESGRAVLKFEGGVQLIIEGPVDFRAISAKRIKLTRGVSTGHVRPSGVGFQVQTLHGMVTDLGTMFDVAVENKKPTKVSVFEGSVTFKAASNEKEQLIKAGQVANAGRYKLNVTSFEVDQEIQGDRLKVLSGVRGVGAQIRVINDRDLKTPSGLKIFQSLAAFPENRDVQPEDTVKVNISEPCSYAVEALEETSEQKDFGGQRADSFLIQFNPPFVDEEKKSLIGSLGELNLIALY